MALVFVGNSSVPAYIALSTDIIDDKISGAGNVGGLVFISDTQQWYIIKKDLTLSPYTLPISIEGDIRIGAVSQGSPGVVPWLVDGSAHTQPVSGTVTANGPLTNTELRDSPITVLSQIPDGPNLDAFSRLRVSSPKTIFDSSFLYDLLPLVYGQVATGGGSITHAPLVSSAQMTVNTVSGAVAIMQSYTYHRYLPGKSQAVLMTQVLGAAVTNVVKRCGYFDSNDGIYLEQNGTTDVAIVRRTSTSGSAVNNRVVQADWNIDKLDGTGASGLTLDLSKASILVIDLQWLGMGRVRVGFDIDGKIIYTHQFLNANSLTVPYMKTGTLPIRWEISNIGTSSGTSMYATCSAVLSEGGDESDASYGFSVSNSADVSVGTTRTGLIAIRPSLTYDGITNRIQISLKEFSVISGANSILVELIYKPTTLTVTGGWTAANSESSVEYHSTITGVTGGVVVQSYFIPSTNTNRQTVASLLKSRYPLTLNIDGTVQFPFVVCATAFTSTSASRARIDWTESR